MARVCEGRVALVTGAARGVGREHALGLAKHGAKVVVNDLGAGVDGSGADTTPAQAVVDEIKALGKFKVKISLHSEVDAEITINVETAESIQ